MKFIPIHQILTKTSHEEWSHYWHLSGKWGDDINTNFPDFIAGLKQQLEASELKRIVLIHSDRSYFLAGFLAALYGGKEIVLPPTDAPGLIKELLRDGDGILSNNENLSSLTSNFIKFSHITLTSHKFSDLDPNCAFITFYTSGSTGSPKEVRKTLQQLENEVHELEQLWGKALKDTIFLSTVPHHHIYGLLFSLLWPISGRHPIRCETFTFWEDLFIGLGPKNTLITSPSHLSRLTDTTQNNIQTIFSSGAP